MFLLNLLPFYLNLMWIALFISITKTESFNHTLSENICKGLHNQTLQVILFLVLLLGHGCENLLHLVHDVVQLVRVRPYDFLKGVELVWLDTDKETHNTN